MQLKRAKKSREKDHLEAQVRTSDEHQSLTIEDLESLEAQESTLVVADLKTTRVGEKPSPSTSIRRPQASTGNDDSWRPPHRSLVHRAVKRTVDIVVSATALVLLSPLMLLISAVVFLTDFGPVFYSQTRVGQGGRRFRFVKFRTMVRNAEALKAELVEQNRFQGDITFKLTNDPRVTRIGRILRKTSLDELPQLWHVLSGEMTLVGPRPAVPSEVAEYSPYEMRRVSVRPGLTCLWQVCGRSDLPFNRQVELDLEYIENESLWFDATILARTVPALVFMKGAY